MPSSASHRKRAGWVLAASLFGVSVAGPLVRFSAADPIAIAIGRIGFSLLAIAVLLAATGEWRQWRTLRGRDWALAIACGVILAFHFWWWNASIHLTTIAASTTLVNSVQPAFVVVLSILIVAEWPTRRQVVGLSVATLGALIITLPDLFTHAPAAPSSAPNPLLGNLLSIGAGAAGATYITIGRRLRGTLGAWAYVGIVYGASFVTLLVIAGITGVHVAPQPSREMLIFAALAVGPMLIGHTGMNWALEHLPAYVVNLTLLGEPVGATLLGMVLPGIHEIPRWTTFAGGAVVLLGVLLTAAAPVPVKEAGIEVA
jgi:drug/metabolite transporter (DMT)-like permease